MSKTEKKTILFSILDWGLGHASRSIPVIRILQDKGFAVIFGGCGPSLAILQEAFPGTPSIELPSYAFKYPVHGRHMTRSVIRALPSMIKAINTEKKILGKLEKSDRIQGSISDNRYGLYGMNIPSRIICHQLNVKVPGNPASIEMVFNQIHRSMLKRFGGIWVPDTSEHSFGGALSESHPSLKNTSYLGPLSRFNTVPNTKIPGTQDFEYCFLLSGPEPQRSILEDKILSQAPRFKRTVALIRGLPGEVSLPQAPPNFSVYNHLGTKEMHSLLLKSRVIIARPGYSTIMDLSAFNCHRIWVPTPGQSEQHYLAEYWSGRKGNSVMGQDDFHLELIESLHKESAPVAFSNHHGLLDDAVNNFIEDIRNFDDFCGNF